MEVSSDRKSNAIVTEIDGVVYPSLKAMADAFNMTEYTIYKRFQRGIRGAELVKKKEKAADKKQAAKYKFAGKEFRSLALASRHFNVKYGTYRTRKRMGWSDEEALGIIPRDSSHKINGQKKKRGKREKVELIAFGITYGGYEALGRAFGRKGNFVRERIVNYGYSPEQAVTTEGRIKRVKAGSFIFPSKEAAAQAVGKTVSQIENLQKKHNINEFGEVVNNFLLLKKVKRSLNKKATSLNEGKSLKDSANRQTGEFYLVAIHLTDRVVYKIGVTTKDVKTRLKPYKLRTELLFNIRGDLKYFKAYEKRMKQEFKAFITKNLSAKDLDGFKECFEFESEEDFNRFGEMYFCSIFEMGLKG